MNNNPNDPNQPPYGQQPPESGEPPPTQYTPQPSPYEQEPVPPPEPDELPPTQYAPPQPSNRQEAGQPPLHQGQPSAYVQPPQIPPYGQPAQYGGVPPIPPGYAAPPPQRKSLKWLWITLSIVGAIFVLACATGTSLLLFASLATPAGTVKNYYSAVEKQDYTTAFSYFATGATFTDTQSGTTVQIPSKAAYINVAKSVDQEFGMLTDYQTNNGSDDKHIVATLTRSGQQYQANLTLTQVNGNWKIANFDSF